MNVSQASHVPFAMGEKTKRGRFIPSKVDESIKWVFHCFSCGKIPVEVLRPGRGRKERMQLCREGQRKGRREHYTKRLFKRGERSSSARRNARGGLFPHTMKRWSRGG